MKLLHLSQGQTSIPLIEGYGRVQDIGYTHWRNDPDPNVLVLGSFIHPTSRNQLMAGINLNYLTKRQVDKLRYYLPEILKNRNLYMRYWIGKRLLPDIFEPFYRYYRHDRITSKTAGTLRFLTPRELEQLGDTQRADKLKKRREQLKKIKAAKRTRKRIYPDRRPVVEPEIPPEAEPVLPPEEPDEPELPGDPETAEKAQRAVDQKRAEKLAQRIDTRTREPEILEPDELEQPEEPEDIEEPDIEQPEDTEEPEK